MKNEYGEWKAGIWYPSKDTDIIALSKEKDKLQDEYWKVIEEAADFYRRAKPMMDKWKGLKVKASILMTRILEIRGIKK